MTDPEIALEVHAREELGVDPNKLGNPAAAAVASFLAFAAGAFVPLVPWLVGSGTSAVWASAISGVGAAALVGGVLAMLTERSVVRTVVRQLLVAGGACVATYLIGGLVGASVV
jgi:VIT1/CCC1 family predicted Fe2+/Mn2+ transporter